MLRAVLFDFDGTLADTEPLHLEAFRRVLGRRGIEISERDYYARYLAGTDRECLARMLDDYRRRDLLPEFEVLYREKVTTLGDLLAREGVLFAGAARFLNEAARIAHLALVTGAVGLQVRAFLDAHQLAALFSVIVAAEDVRRGKPDPEGYRGAVERLREHGLSDVESNECLALEDSPSGIAAARSAGLRTIALAHSRPVEELRSADRVVASYHAIDWRDVHALFTSTRAPA